ncbi:MAG: Bug family tripartite tricarboxylate transporter substrate binding protein [Burkholderiales bacterium]
MKKTLAVAPSRRLFVAAGLALVAAIPAVPAMAQDFPARRVRILIGQPPGGGSDLLTRLLADKLTHIWSQPVTVESLPGASGAIAMQALIRAAPDGHTLGLLNFNNVVFVEMARNPPYSLERDITPIISVSRSSNVLVVGPAVKAGTIPELLAFIRANPGKISFASGGAGAPAHVAGELFKLQTGVEMVHVPYKGAGPAIQDVLAGNVTLMFAAAPAALPFVRAGKLRALAVTSDTRSEQTPEIPSLAESGIQFDVRDFQGIVGPAGLPGTISARIHADLQKVLDMPDIKARIAAAGGETTGGSAAAFTTYVRIESEKWRRVVRDAKLSIE